MSSSAALLEALDACVDPLVGRGLAAAGAVKSAAMGEAGAAVDLELAFPAAGYSDTLVKQVQSTVREKMNVDCAVTVQWRIQSHSVQRKLKPIPNIRNIIAVASGKGGVGKSTVSVNLALALKAEGATVGILDADIYGPSQPRMLGSTEHPTSKDGKVMEPIVAHGLQTMSIGFLIDEDQPTIWRGPMVTQALVQMLSETRWDDLDYLIVDMPPGTGDIQLTLSQRIPVSGAIIVTTPQDIALLDARKALQMFRKVEVPVLGVVENMATHVCSNCGHEEAIFGVGGGNWLAEKYSVEMLGSLPLDAKIREQVDGGNPTVVAEPESKNALAYRDIARRAAARLAYGVPVGSFPTIEVVDD